jgi:DNA-binding response OmpR family regulator
MDLQLNILLVEDESFFQKFYVLKLQEHSFVVDLATDGEEGICKIGRGKYDCVLLDIIMPKKNGFEVLEFAKENAIIPHTPIIMFSTLGQDTDIQKALSMGAADYANKAFFDFDTLLYKIEKAVKTRKHPK